MRPMRPMRPTRDRGADLPSVGVLAVGIVVCLVLVLLIGWAPAP